MDTWTQVDTCLLPPQRCSSAVCKFLLIPVTEMATHRPLSRFLRHLVPERAEGQGLGRPVMMGQWLCRETKAGACEQVREGASVLSPPCVLHPRPPAPTPCPCCALHLECPFLYAPPLKTPLHPPRLTLNPTFSRNLPLMPTREFFAPPSGHSPHRLEHIPSHNKGDRCLPRGAWAGAESGRRAEHSMCVLKAGLVCR